MKGVNELILNEATMTEIVQFYLNAKFMPDAVPRVTAVEPARDGHANEFRVRVEGDREPSVREASAA